MLLFSPLMIRGAANAVLARLYHLLTFHWILQLPHLTAPADFTPKQTSLSVLYGNSRSILPKLDHMRLLASAQSPHLICLCETWLDESISDSKLLIPGFCLIRRDRARQGGGVAMYIQDSISFSVTLSHQSIELLIVHLKLKKPWNYVRTILQTAIVNSRCPSRTRIYN